HRFPAPSGHGAGASARRRPAGGQSIRRHPENQKRQNHRHAEPAGGREASLGDTDPLESHDTTLLMFDRHGHTRPRPFQRTEPGASQMPARNSPYDRMTSGPLDLPPGKAPLRAAIRYAKSRQEAMGKHPLPALSIAPRWGECRRREAASSEPGTSLAS